MESPRNIVLLITCPDQQGIVAKVSNFVFENQGNIIDSQQHSEGLDSTFFMRVCFEASQMKLNGSPVHTLNDKFAEIANSYKMDFAFHRQDKKKRMAILVSKYDHCLYDVLLRHQYGELDIEIPVIISNHKDLKHVADNFKIPFHYVPVDKEKHDSIEAAKEASELEIVELLDDCDIDFVVLARYMQILTKKIINEYPFKIINVHHGFLPAFKGAKPYHQAFEKGVKIIGATAHYATEDLDMGPIIEQDVIRVAHRDYVEDYLAKGRDIEKLVFARAIKGHIEDKIIIYNKRTIVFD